MKRLLASLVLLALVLPGCAGTGKAPPRQPAAPQPKPVALLVAVEHPRHAERNTIEFTPFVFRVGLDGVVTTLPIQPVSESPIVADADGRRILYSKAIKDPIAHELRVYDQRTGSDTVLLSDQVLAYGWDGTATVALIGRADGYSNLPFFPHGSNLDIREPVITVGSRGAITTAAVDPPTRLTADLDFAGGDEAAWYFATQAGDLVAVSRKTTAASVVATWGTIHPGLSLRRSEPETVGRPAVGNGLRPDTFSEVGMPMLFSKSSGSGLTWWIEVHRVSDWRLVRKLAAPPGLSYRSVLSPDLTRFALAAPGADGSLQRLRTIAEVDGRGRTRELATATPTQDSLWPLTYVGASHDFAYAALTSSGDADLYLYEQAKSASRRFAHLTRSQLIGTNEVAGIDVTPGRVVGIEYER